MDFVRYADSGSALVNTDLADLDGLRDLLDQRQWLVVQVDERDLKALRRFQTALRPVFTDAEARIPALNELMARHPITPYISDHVADDLHLHVATKAASVADLLISEALLGLASVICDLGVTRLGVCAATDCERVYVDTSPNASRRYCSDRCSSRANVAAFRARQKAASA